MMAIKVLSCASSNVRSLRGGSAVPTSFANSLGVNILALQETHMYIPSDISHLQINNPNFDFFFDNGTASARGVAFAVRKHVFDEVVQIHLNLTLEEPDFYPTESGRACAIRVQVQNGVYFLVCVYAPNSKVQRQHFFRALSQACLLLPSTPILLGDWNTISSPTDRFPQHISSADDPESFHALMQSLNVLDIFRELHPEVSHFTFIRPSQDPTRTTATDMSRIDLILIPRGLAPQVLVADIVAVHNTDHAQSPRLILESPEDITCARPPWRLNPAHLESPIVRQRIETIIADYSNCSDPGWDVWSALKLKIKSFYNALAVVGCIFVESLWRRHKKRLI